ncbi:MAG: hypothetical protein ACI311_05810 [Bacilli bacterium]
MSFRKYKTIDICIFILLAVVFEILNYYATTKLEDFGLIFLSYSIVITLICMFRWGLVGSVVGLCGGLTACLIAGSSDIGQYVAYAVGNLTIILPALIFQVKIGKDKLKEKKILLFVYLLCCFITVFFFRCLIISLFDIKNFASTFIQAVRNVILIECMSVVISFLILIVASRKNSELLVDMKEYVLKVQDNMKLGGLKEYKSKEYFNFDKPFTEEDEIDEAFLLDGGKMSNAEMEQLDELFKDDIQSIEQENANKN